ncbi:MAG: hypothetical protein AYK19_18610 [Theionarchaea archaeon DG-70-1]|nr:MAG: hypothetical protein AYK19_18610 [Theionarchaea archaeon DG-70-1]
MLTAFSVKNFKSIRDSGKICIKPLTIFIGPNNSGKSSVLQFLLAVKQTVESRGSDTPFSTGGSSLHTEQRKEHVDLGIYEDFIFLNDKKRNISFNFYFETDLTDTNFHLDESRKASSRKTNVETESVISYRENRIYLKTFTVNWDGKTITFKSPTDIEQNVVDEKALSEIMKNPEISALYTREKFYYIPLSSYLTQKLALSYYETMKGIVAERGILEGMIRANHILTAFQETITVAFEKLFYLGPLREYPQRYYLFSDEKPVHVGIKGEKAVEILFVSKNTSREIFQNVNSWFKNLGLGELSFDRRGPLYTLNVAHPTIKKGSQDLKVNIAAGGFGASQLLQVIVEGFYAPENAVIIIEKPEIHLHPRLQAEMGDLLVDIAKTGKRLIVETHSEYLLLRIQRRIAEGTIDTDDVVVYYFEQTEEGTRITKLELDKFGRFINWPKGFFEEDLMEAYEHSKAIAEKIDEGVV